MKPEIIFEIIGYVGSVLVLVSMLMTSVVRLRIINLIGSAIFTVYAVLIRSYPTAFLNFCLVCVNVYQLLRLRRTAGRNKYEIRKLSPGESFTEWFLEKHLDDVRRYFPAFSPEEAKRAGGFAVFYDDQASGLLLGTESEEGFEVLLDYTTPAFRDCSVGAWLYRNLPAEGVTRLLCRADSAEHRAYLEKMGFVSKDGERFCRDLTEDK